MEPSRSVGGGVGNRSGRQLSINSPGREKGTDLTVTIVGAEEEATKAGCSADATVGFEDDRRRATGASGRWRKTDRPTASCSDNWVTGGSQRQDTLYLLDSRTNHQHGWLIKNISQFLNHQITGIFRALHSYSQRELSAKIKKKSQTPLLYDPPPRVL